MLIRDAETFNTVEDEIVKAKKCKQCKSSVLNQDIAVRTPLFVFCSFKCAKDYALIKSKAARQRLDNKAKKAAKVKHAIDKKSVKRRSDWYATLQALVNQWVTKVRDIDEACCTCGTRKPDIKYDAGHFFTVAARPDIRFNTMNIHKQCNQKCNVYGSGMRLEYKEFIIARYGQEGLDELTLEGNPLKEQFPAWSDIEDGIKKYRQILRDAGIKPCR